MEELKPDVVVDIDENNASQLLIEESHNRLVVVDFWAEWCEPCKTLMPILEKIAAEYEGAFLLAKVNADDQQMIAQQFGVRSLPTVMLILEGKPVDGFAGAQSESVVRQLLEKHLPPPWEGLLLEARSVAETGDSAKAISLYRKVWETSGGASVFYDLSVVSQSNVGNVTDVGSLQLPVTLGVEVKAASWLTWRASLSQSLYGTFEAANGDEQSDQRTILGVGASLMYGNLQLDGTIATAANGTLGYDNGNGDDDVMSNVSMTYTF